MPYKGTSGRKALPHHRRGGRPLRREHLVAALLEKEFRELRPKRTNKGDRLYTKADIGIAKIHHLVKEGLHHPGMKEALRTKGGRTGWCRRT